MSDWGVRRYVARCHRARADDGVVTHSDSRQDRRATTNLDVAASGDRQAELEALPQDLRGYRMLAEQLRPALAGGETYGTAAEFKPFLDAGCMDVLQPDIAICGGLTGVGRVTSLAELYDRPVVPHVWGSRVNFHAALHLTATLPTHRAGAAASFPYLEFDAGPNPLLDLAGRPTVSSDGTVAVPSDPGLGIEIRPESLAPYTIWHRQLDA